ncbi:MAG: PSD1 and planctomycete cytochrome C domain-containing protein [Bryobacteraceae bacterium]|nr:PSD1 and planctomycete cytochrome C domain-containing protein [Bryobacteraceae bacterium]
MNLPKPPVLLWALLALFSEPAAAVDFNREIRPILSEKCYQCHGPDDKNRFAGLRLDDRSEATKTRLGRAAIVPGQPQQSELLKRVMLASGPKKMPLNKEPLTKVEIDKLSEWIREGARFDEHWSLVPPVKKQQMESVHPVPAETGIDQFIRDALKQRGLTLAPKATPPILLRRLHLDLTGLPPSIEQVKRFEANPSEAAYRSVVEELLASPRFGEKWARHWLDLARYSDSSGYQHDDLRSVWPYRDWVIRAFNDDKPFDQFTIEQLAGDLLPDATIDQKIATGFHRNSAVNLGGDIDLAESLHMIRVDRVNTTGTVWQAATWGCAQCHTHKYDPFTINDYYSALAFFSQAEDDVVLAGDGSLRKRNGGPRVELPVAPEAKAEHAVLVSRRSGLERELGLSKERAIRDQARWEASHAADTTLPGNIRKILAVSPAQRTELDSFRLREFYLDKDPETSRLKAELDSTVQRLTLIAPETFVMAEKKAPTRTHVLLRGNLGSPGPEVAASTPKAFAPAWSGFSPNRLGLAKWLVDRGNPLTARVTVNRIWAEIFGQGIVLTSEDFGRQGEAPSHPDLLDWLAVEFMDNGWSMKHVIREIVLSSTYRQSSTVSAEILSVDPANRLLSRGPRFRLEAEAIRDTILAASGLLSHSLGGPPAYPAQPDNLWSEISGADVDKYVTSSGDDRYRRGIYTIWRRGNPYPSFLNFDASPRLDCTARRIRTNTPLQALTLLNDPVYTEAAAALATLLMDEAETSGPGAALETGFRRVAARRPSEAEAEVLRDELQTRVNHYRLNQAKAKSLSVRYSRSSSADPANFAAWFSIARILLNLDETVTKG